MDEAIARLAAIGISTILGADFWAMAYDDFADIETPRPNRPTHLNPAHVLDYHRFLDRGVTDFQRDQVDILRAAQPRWWITHNGCFGSIDYHGAFTRDLDFLGYDSDPFFDSAPGHRPQSHAFNLDYVRAYSGNFIVPEQQSGPGGQTQYLHDTPEPGEMRRMALTSIARGADSLLSALCEHLCLPKPHAVPENVEIAPRPQKTLQSQLTTRVLPLRTSTVPGAAPFGLARSQMRAM